MAASSELRKIRNFLLWKAKKSKRGVFESRYAAAGAFYEWKIKKDGKVRLVVRTSDGGKRKKVLEGDFMTVFQKLPKKKEHLKWLRLDRDLELRETLFSRLRKLVAEEPYRTGGSAFLRKWEREYRKLKEEWKKAGFL